MSRVQIRPVLLFGLLVALSCSSCQRTRRCYAVRGQVLVNGKPATGAMIVFHPQEGSSSESVQPSATVQADGTFVLRSYMVQDRVVAEGAPAGKYIVTCVWYPPDLPEQMGKENLPDQLRGRYADPARSELHAEVREEPTDLPPFELRNE